MIDSFQILCNALAKLDARQLQEIRARAGALLRGHSVAGSPTESGWPPADLSEHMLLLLADFARDKGIEFSSYGALRQSSGWKSFQEHATAFAAAYVTSSTSNRAEFDTMCRSVYHLLILRMRSNGWTVSARTIMRNMFQAASVVEASFPGYKEQGVLGLIISGGMKHKTGKEMEHARKK